MRSRSRSRSTFPRSTAGTLNTQQTFNSRAKWHSITTTITISLIHSEMNDDSGSNASNDIAAPLVFQCASCLSIVGDSWHWLCSDASLQSFSLQAATGIVVDTERAIELDTSRKDSGSAYHSLTCAKCHSVLGRVYKTTTQELDDLRCLASTHAPSYAQPSERLIHQRDDVRLCVHLCVRVERCSRSRSMQSRATSLAR